MAEQEARKGVDNYALKIGYQQLLSYCLQAPNPCCPATMGLGLCKPHFFFANCLPLRFCQKRAPEVDCKVRGRRDLLLYVLTSGYVALVSLEQHSFTLVVAFFQVPEAESSLQFPVMPQCLLFYLFTQNTLLYTWYQFLILNIWSGFYLMTEPGTNRNHQKFLSQVTTHRNLHSRNNTGSHIEGRVYQRQIIWFRNLSKEGKKQVK